MFDSSETSEIQASIDSRNQSSLQEDHPLILAMHDSGVNQDDDAFNNLERHHNSLNDINVNENINPNSINAAVDNSVRNHNQPLNMDLD